VNRELTPAQRVHLGLVRRLMPVMNGVIRASKDQADDYMQFVTVDVLHDDALLEVRLFYISAVVCAWFVVVFGGLAAMFAIAIPAGLVFGEDARQWIAALLAGVIAGSSLPVGIGALWFRRLARRAAGEAVKPGADPALVRRLAHRAMPGGGLLLAQVVVALLAVAISLG
jgi:hypothetical protein